MSQVPQQPQQPQPPQPQPQMQQPQAWPQAWPPPQPEVPVQQWAHAPQPQPSQPPEQQWGEALGKDAPRRFSVHHSYIWLGAIRLAFVILVAVAISLAGIVIEAIAEGPGAGFAVLLAAAAFFLVFFICVGISALYQWLSYKHLYYEIGDEEFNLYSGIFNKRRVHVPYRRVQSVDQRASLLQRVVGVCSVYIDTAGGSSNKAVIVPYVTKSQADALRTELFARKQLQIAQAAAGAKGCDAHLGQQAGASAVQAPIDGNILDAPASLWQEMPALFDAKAFVPEAPVAYQYGLSNKELILTGLSNSTSFAVVVLTLIVAIVQGVSTFAPALGLIASPVVRTVSDSMLHVFGGSLVAIGIVVFLAVAVVGWLFSAVGTCVSYGGFRARRRGSRIEVEHGLLQHRIQGVDIDRVQSVIVKQSFIRRLFGYCELSLGKIDAVESDSSGQQATQRGLVVHPFAKVSRVPEILAGLAPEFASAPVEVNGLPKVALRRAIVRRGIVQGTGFWLAVVIAIGQIIANVSLSPYVPKGGLAGVADIGGLFGILEEGNFADAATQAAAAVAGLSFANAIATALYVVCAVLLVIDIVGAVLWYRGSGFACSEEFMKVTNAGLSCQSALFSRRKIQYGFVRTNPLQRHAKTATICARTAAGVGGTTVSLIDVGADDADAWLSWIEPRR